MDSSNGGLTYDPDFAWRKVLLLHGSISSDEA